MGGGGSKSKEPIKIEEKPSEEVEKKEPIEIKPEEPSEQAK